MRALLSSVVAFVVVSGCTQPDPTSASAGGSSPGGTETSRQLLQPQRPIIGGQLATSADLTRILVADAENDRLRVFDLANGLKYEVSLPNHSWPTRALELTDGKIRVLLRATGELAIVTPASGDNKPAQVATVAVCAEPRALTAGKNPGEVLVGCAGGELVTVAGSQVGETVASNVEWRDLTLLPDGSTQGTSFRAAELVSFSGGVVNTRLKPPAQRLSQNPINTTDVVMHLPQVAWRMVPASGGRTFVVHQLHADSIRVESMVPGLPPIPPSSNPYGGGVSTGNGPGLPPACNDSAVVTGITTVNAGGVTAVQRTNDVLPVDAALSPDGTQLAVASAGGTGLSIYPTGLLDKSNPCLTPTAGLTGISLTSVVWVSNTKLVVMESLRSTPMVFDLATGASRMMGNEADRSSPAHALFHHAPRNGAALACASCHPEGGEDGHVWNIDGKPRRTQSLAGGVMERMPFHWRGDLSNLSSLMTDTFEKRMGGAPIPADLQGALGTWLDTIPAPKASVVLSADAKTAGLAAFAKGQCTSCHLDNGHVEGPAADIGTGESVRSPSLIGLQARAPYLHTGEIIDIRARVMGNLHSAHGRVDLLSMPEKESLITYLQSL
jgi:mono/diheme cytochrome c family protein